MNKLRILSTACSIPTIHVVAHIDNRKITRKNGTRRNSPVFTEAGGLERTRWGTVVADEETGRATTARVWAGGDVVTGAATVISAMGAGKRAAADIDRFLRGETAVEGWD